MRCTTRKATTNDFAAILLLIQEFALFQQTPEKVSITLNQMKIDEGLFECFVAEDEQQDIIGFASFYRAYYSWSGKAIYLDDLYVKESCRKNGAGKILLQQVIELAAKEGCNKVRWQVSKWNSNAIDFYKSMGANTDDTEINCDLVLQ